jgi:hypothetical protein
MATINAIDSNIPIAVSQGGTGQTTLASGDVLVGNGTSGITASSNLTINGSGYILTPSQPMFAAYNSASQTNVTGDGTAYTVQYNSTWFNISSSFNTSTYIFTAPIAGHYLFTVTCSYGSVTSSYTTLVLALQTTQNKFELFRASAANLQTGNNISVSGSRLCIMALNDTAYVTTTVSGSTKSISINSGTSSNSSVFTGQLVG